MPRPSRHVSPARRLPDELVAAAHDYQHRNRVRLVEVGEHFGVSGDRLRDEFRRHGLKCVKTSGRRRRDAAPRTPAEQACTDEQVRVAHTWYLKTKDATMDAAAAKFGLSYDRFRDRMISLGLPGKNFYIRPVDAAFVRPFREEAAKIERRQARRLRCEL